jgi:hypothetical protein
MLGAALVSLTNNTSCNNTNTIVVFDSADMLFTFVTIIAIVVVALV